MVEMVKQVAAAIGCVDADRCNGRRPVGSCEDCLAAGRRAIAAMRRPTAEMRKVCSFEMAELEYPAMIDAALGHGDPTSYGGNFER